MNRLAWGSTLCILALLVSGCSAETGTTADALEKVPLTASDLRLDEEGGVVQGNVVSEDLLPIAGAAVALRGTSLQDATDANGFFQLVSVPPQEYILDVARLGYEAAAKAVVVEIAQITNVQFQLRTIEIGEEVFYETAHHAGFLECAMGAVVFVAPCTYPYRLAYGTLHNNGVNLSHYGAPPDLQPNKFWLNFTVKPKAAQLVAELQWTPGSAAASRMNLFILCGDFDPVLNECTERIRYGNSNGHAGGSPVRAVIDGQEFTKKGCPNSKFCLKDRPIWLANDVAMPFSNPQVAFQQRFQVWDTIFYNGPGPDDFTVIPD